jgi:hypothetical protein
MLNENYGYIFYTRSWLIYFVSIMLDSVCYIKCVSFLTYTTFSGLTLLPSSGVCSLFDDRFLCGHNLDPT